MIELQQLNHADIKAFVTEFDEPLNHYRTPDDVLALFQLQSTAPLQSSDTVRSTVRTFLKQAGFKATGRSKPASEYLLKAASERSLASINLAVDWCNAVSLHSGLPISVIDLDKLEHPLQIAFGKDGQSYVFNASGQQIDIAGLMCLFDKSGPCANPVKDAQRSKTTGESKRTLSILWGTTLLPAHSEKTKEWYITLIQRCSFAHVKMMDITLI